jgi:protein phosphatase
MSIAAYSHIGCVRANNEDNFFLNGRFMDETDRLSPCFASDESKPPFVLGLADGMGGYAKGELASLTAMSVLAEYAPKFDCSNPAKQVQCYVRAANNIICETISRIGAQIGCTLALAVVRGNKVYGYSLGDSRIYLLSNGSLRCLSVDNTRAMDYVREGVMTESVARASDDWRKLTKCLGMFNAQLSADETPQMTVKGFGRVMICSDGLSNVVDDQRIMEILINTPSAEDAVKVLVGDALDGGAPDNVTVAVGEIGRKGKGK